MEEKKNRLKLTAISGFPEWLPEERMVELRMLDSIRSTFERYGFTSIETPAVERLDVLLAKGEAEHEMYKVERLAGAEDSHEAKFGLHYDLTVPFARYVAQNFGALDFPFKRYQIQDVWRGERPQVGRYRQFKQCDIDVINVNKLPLSFDAEVPAIVFEALAGLDVGEFELHLSNRKILHGFLEGLGIEQVLEATRILDKLEKLGPKAIEAMLQETLRLPTDTTQHCLEIATICRADESFSEAVRKLGVQNKLLDQGLEELTALLKNFRELSPGKVFADLSVTRGFDYYTGSVYEAKWLTHPALGTVAAGGRYDNLASKFSTQTLPGVGMSIGFTRIFGKLVADRSLKKTQKCPTQILVSYLDQAGSQRARQVAQVLRSRGFSVEVYYEEAKLTKQLQYANKKGIPYFWFETDSAVKNMSTGEQHPADPYSWTPEEPIIE